MKGGLYKVANIISVSLNKEQKEFIDEMHLSPSDLLQRSINDLIENNKISQKRVDELQRNIARLQDVIFRMGTFITKKGLEQEWLQCSVC